MSHTHAISLLSVLVLAATASAEPQLQVADPHRRIAEPPQAARVDPAQEAYVKERINQAQRRELGTVGHSVAANGRLTREAEKRWTAVIAEVARSGRPVNVNALVQWVMRESYLETNRDLERQAEKVRRYNEQKQAIRKRLEQKRARQTGAQTGGKELDAEMRKWEEELQTVGDDAQLANVDLQNMLQKQQQTMQMMSQISKQLHDTAMAVIRKMGG
jgi:hypothetical protein